MKLASRRDTVAVPIASTSVPQREYILANLKNAGAGLKPTGPDSAAKPLQHAAIDATCHQRTPKRCVCTRAATLAAPSADQVQNKWHVLCQPHLLASSANGNQVA